MRRLCSQSRIGELVIAPALYGFSVGLIRSPRTALFNLLKLPLLILTSTLVAALAYALVAKLLLREAPLREVRRLVLGCYGEIGTLLASLAPVCLFFALSFERPTGPQALGEYPLFLGLNVALIAVVGCVAVVRQGRALLRRFAVPPARGWAVVIVWLGLSLIVGGQTAWYLRPFFGNAGVAEDDGFCLGSRPDFRGATSFYEAVGDLLVAPP